MFKALEAEYVVFDVETTGLSVVEGDRIIELAALRIKNGVWAERVVSLVNPGRPLSPGAQEVNGITEDMVLAAPSAAEFLPRMIEFTAQACLVAHNASFDIKFLAYELALGGRKLYDATPVIDTIKMAKAFLPYLSSYRLGSLANSLGVKVGLAHRAEADVEITAAVFQRLLAMAEDHNIHDLKTLAGRFGVEKPSFKLNNSSQASFF
ncbi:MAG: 3'-5' exonuclease [Candidatus Omnitrophica bacterium]|nr:3'-5' exonuclease [Candidatus Omnitrophota bacterium]